MQNNEQLLNNDAIMQANICIYGFRAAGKEEHIIKLAKAAFEALEPENKTFVLNVAKAIVEAKEK